MSNTKTIAICNQKGGVTKTTTTVNLDVGLARQGKRVLIVDIDPQADATTCLGWPEQDKLPITLAGLLEKSMNDEPLAPGEGILYHAEGVDLVPSSIELSGLELSLITAMSREFALRNYLAQVKSGYDYVLIDTMPSLGMLTVNALAAADSVLIPVQAQYLSAKGMTQLVRTIGKVKKQINPALRIDGILLTLVDVRTNFARDTANLLRQNYGGVLRIFKTHIPLAVKAAETSATGTSIFTHDRNGKIAKAYENLAKEVDSIGSPAKNEPALGR